MEILFGSSVRNKLPLALRIAMAVVAEVSNYLSEHNLTLLDCEPTNNDYFNVLIFLSFFFLIYADTVYAYEYIMGTIGLASSVYIPYVESMVPPGCSGAACTESCTIAGNLTTMEADSFYTGPYAVLSGFSYGTPPCDGKCDSQNMSLLAANVAAYGPASICVNAGTWNDYVEGVLTQAACGSYASFAIDHCVQLTGYNAEAAQPYWLVRNSWATK
jgi:Papain family cysteine protease